MKVEMIISSKPRQESKWRICRTNMCASHPRLETAGRIAGDSEWLHDHAVWRGLEIQILLVLLHDHASDERQPALYLPGLSRVH